MCTNDWGGCTYTTEHPSTIIPVHRTLSWVPDPCSIALTSEQDGVYEGLRLVQVVQEKQACRHQAEDYGEVVGDEIVRQGHGWVRSVSSSV